MPSLSSQALQLRSLLETELPGQAELEVDAQSAILGALGARASALPDGAIEMLSRELCFVLLLVLKRTRLPYSAEIGIAPLAAPIVLLSAAHAAASDGDGLVGAAELAAVRSDTLNALSAALAKLFPALVAGAPWGLAANGTPSPPPNQPLLASFWLLVQWESPALTQQLQRGVGVSMLLMHAMLSLLSTGSSSAGVIRLVELSLWDATPPVAPCHPALLLCAVLRSAEAALLAVEPNELTPALRECLCVPTILAAERLHANARSLATRLPASLRASLDASWCAGKPPHAPYVCAWLSPAEVAPEAGAAVGRFWVVDLRSTSDFDQSHYALTMHLPPEAAKQPEAREALRAELVQVCSESEIGVALLTAADPLGEPAANGGLSADDTRRIVHEFVRAGFRRVGVVGGGYAALTREQLASLVTDDVTPRSEAEGGASSSSKAAAAVGMIGGAIKNTFNFAKRRAKPAPVSPPS